MAHMELPRRATSPTRVVGTASAVALVLSMRCQRSATTESAANVSPRATSRPRRPEDHISAPPRRPAQPPPPAQSCAHHLSCSRAWPPPHWPQLASARQTLSPHRPGSASPRAQTGSPAFRAGPAAPTQPHVATQPHTGPAPCCARLRPHLQQPGDLLAMRRRHAPRLLRQHLRATPDTKRTNHSPTGPRDTSHIRYSAMATRRTSHTRVVSLTSRLASAVASPAHASAATASCAARTATCGACAHTSSYQTRTQVSTPHTPPRLALLGCAAPRSGWLAAPTTSRLVRT
jgi:hypothetical protein